MNQEATAYIDELMDSGAKAPTRQLAVRCFDMAEGAANGLLLNKSMTPHLHSKLMARIAGLRTQVSESL